MSSNDYRKWGVLKRDHLMTLCGPSGLFLSRAEATESQLEEALKSREQVARMHKSGRRNCRIHG